jgi:hypothetical protein
MKSQKEIIIKETNKAQLAAWMGSRMSHAKLLARKWDWILCVRASLIESIFKRQAFLSSTRKSHGGFELISGSSAIWFGLVSSRFSVRKARWRTRNRPQSTVCNRTLENIKIGKRKKKPWISRTKKLTPHGNVKTVRILINWSFDSLHEHQT